MQKVTIELDLGVYRGLKRDAAKIGIPWQKHAADLVSAGVEPMTAEEISQIDLANREADLAVKPVEESETK